MIPTHSTNDSLRVLTFNVWGLKYLSKRRIERISNIAHALKDSMHDIIGFQELWADYDLVKNVLRPNFPYSKYWHTAAFGSGLAIFSKFPIVDSSVFSFSLNGCPSDLAGDWFAGKAVVSAVIAHPVLGEVEVFNTHFFARGGEEGPEHWRAVRITNAWEMSKIIRRSLASGRHVIAVSDPLSDFAYAQSVQLGDYNTSPHSLPMKIMLSHGTLFDAWAATNRRHPHPPAPVGRDARLAMETFGLTVDSPLNTWSHGKPLDAFARRWLGKRLDYILFRSPRPDHSSLIIQSTEIVFTDNVPGHDFSYSDHFGLEATFTMQTAAGDPGQVGQVNTNPNSTAVDERPEGLSDDDILTALGALAFEYRAATARANRHLAHFGGCVGLLFLILIGSAWVRVDSRWVAPVATFLGAVTTWWGTTALYVGFVYGKWEKGILENLIEEVEETRHSVPMAHDM